LGPIQTAFSKLKTLIRKAAARNYYDLWPDVGRVRDLLSDKECSNFFKAAGSQIDWMGIASMARTHSSCPVRSLDFAFGKGRLCKKIERNAKDLNHPTRSEIRILMRQVSGCIGHLHTRFDIAAKRPSQV